MSELITDNDRVELLKQWWDKNGTALIVGIIIGLALILGWQYWQKQQLKQHVAASQAYQQLLSMSVHEHPEDFIQQAQMIVSRYPRTPYASLSSLLLAHAQVDQNNYTAAYQSNIWVVSHAKDKALKQIARVRAARLLLALGQPDEALNLLNNIDDKSFAILIDEVRGDIYVVKKDFPAARKAYLQAQQDAPDSEIMSPALQLKLSSLPQAAAATLPNTFSAKAQITDK